MVTPVTPEVTIVKLPDRMTVGELVDIADPNVPLAKLWKEERPYIEKLMRDIEASGMKRPVTVVVYPDGSKKLWEGHHRLVAAQKLGLKDIPTRFVGPTDAPITEFILERGAIPKAEASTQQYKCKYCGDVAPPSAVTPIDADYWARLHVKIKHRELIPKLAKEHKSWSEIFETHLAALPSPDPLILKQYPLGQVPEKIKLNLEVPMPPPRGTKVAPRTNVVVPENAALRTNVELDRAVEHLGYQSVSLSEEEVAGLEKPIPTDVELINESQRRLRRLKVIPDGQLNTRQLAHLKLARVLAQTICYRNPLSGVYAASIPPASDRVRTVGTYGTKNKAGYIALDSLDTGRITIDTLIHELGHHQQYQKTGEAEDLEIEHAEAMTSIAGEAVAIVGTGKLDKLLVDVAW